MGEVSRNIVVILALVVIAVSALGTWAVMNAAMDIFQGRQIPASDQESVVGGVVRVNVGPPQPPLSGRVSVTVNDVE